MKRARYLLIAAALLLPAVVSAGFPVVRVVPTDFNTIQAAVDASNPGDTVMVRPGVYNENVSVDTPNLLILGRCQAKHLSLDFQDDPAKTTLIDGGMTGNVFDISASDVHLACLTTRHGDMGINFSEFGPRGFVPSISGFTMTRVTVLEPRGFGVYIEGDRFRVSRSRIIGAGWDGLYVSVGHGGVVEYSSVRGADGSCYYFNWSHDTEFTNNVGIDCNGYGVQMYGDDNTFTDNEFRTNGAGGYFEGNNFIVQDNSIQDSGYQDNCLSVYGDNMLVQGNDVEGCYYDGIEAFGSFAEIVDNSSNTVTDDYCFDVGGEEMTFSNNRCGSGNYYGVHFVGDNSLLSENIVDGAVYEAFYVEGSNNEVSGNTVSRGNDGMEIYGDDNLVQNNSVSQTLFESIYVYGDFNPRVIDNVSDRGSSAMIQVYCNGVCNSAEVIGNEVLSGGSSGGGSGIYVRSESGMTISGNSVRNVRGYGFELYCDSCTVSNNNAFDNGSRRDFGAGFQVGGDGSMFTDNLASGNTGPGFKIDGSNNSFVYNSSMQNLLEGFRVTFLATGTLLDQNAAEHNHSEGIDNQGVQTGVTSNLSQYNRIDCANSGTITTLTGSNYCLDNSNYANPGELD